MCAIEWRGHGDSARPSTDHQASHRVHARCVLRPLRNGQARLFGQRCAYACMACCAGQAVQGARHPLRRVRHPACTPLLFGELPLNGSTICAPDRGQRGSLGGDTSQSPDEFEPSDPRRPKNNHRSARSDNRASEEFFYQGFNLKAWIAQYGSTYEVETALRSHPENEEIFRQERSEGGVHIECPFEDEHSEPGGTGTFVTNASDNGDRGIGVHCCHNSRLANRGTGQRVDRLIFITRMLDSARLLWRICKIPSLAAVQYRPASTTMRAVVLGALISGQSTRTASVSMRASVTPTSLPSPANSISTGSTRAARSRSIQA